MLDKLAENLRRWRNCVEITAFTLPAGELLHMVWKVTQWTASNYDAGVKELRAAPGTSACGSCERRSGPRIDE
jgi:hypothetical protein